ncbi:MAG: hypothetical protein ACM3WV_03400 [Bacillota bacterium]
MNGMRYELISLKWYEKSMAETALELLRGLKTFSDLALPGVNHKAGEFYKFHYRLTENELRKYR